MPVNSGEDRGQEEQAVRGQTVEIFVNDQAVSVADPRVTGLEIKEAAIAAGLPIDLGFQLIEELPHDRTRVVGDRETVEARPGSRFLALAPDDNS